MNDKTGPKKILKYIIILLALLLLFAINTIKFLLDENSRIPILNALFNMIIFLFIIVLIFHKNSVSHTLGFREDGWIQTILDNYFKK